MTDAPEPDASDSAGASRCAVTGLRRWDAASATVTRLL
jgi:hypothetical protein